MHYYTEALRNYANFNGRSSRRAFWMFTLFDFLIHLFFTIMLVSNVDINLEQMAYSESYAESAMERLDNSIWMLLVNIYYYATLLPRIAVFARRVHDTNNSAWWAAVVYICMIIGSFLSLFGLIGVLVFGCKAGTQGDNQYGPDPYGVEEPEHSSNTLG